MRQPPKPWSVVKTGAIEGPGPAIPWAAALCQGAQQRGWGFSAGKDALAACAHPGEAWCSHQSPQEPPSWCSLPAMFYNMEKDNKANSKWQPSMSAPRARCLCLQLGTHEAHRHILSPWMWALPLVPLWFLSLKCAGSLLFLICSKSAHKVTRNMKLKMWQAFFCCCLLFDGFWKRNPTSGFLPGGLCCFTYEECIFHKQLFYIANSGLLFQTDRLLLLKFPPRSQASFKSMRVNLEIL